MRERDFKESFSGIGTVTIRPFKIGENGKRYYLPYQKHNLIVEAGRASLIDMLIGERVRHLRYIRWGSGGALTYPDGDPLNPLPVDDKDTDVKSFLVDKPLSPYNRISPTQVEYIETLIADEVDSDVSEAAMLLEDPQTNDRSIWARITFPTVRLTIQAGTGLEIRWVFDFSRAEEIPLEYEENPIEVPTDTPIEEDTTPPAEVTGLSATYTADTATLTWTNPTSNETGDFSHIRILRDGTEIATDITGETYTDTGLTSGTTYDYLVQTVDTNLNTSAGVAVSVTPGTTA